MLTLLELALKARKTLPFEPSPVNTLPGKTRLKPERDGIATIILSSGSLVPPNSMVRLTDALLVLVAYSHTSSITPLLAGVV